MKEVFFVNKKNNLLNQTGRRGLALMLTLVMTLSLVLFSTTISAADTSISIVQGDTVSAIQSSITTALGSYDTVTVTGGKTDVGSTLTLTIPAGKKLIWQADYQAAYRKSMDQ